MKVLKGILLVTLSSIFSDAPQASELEEKSAWGKPVKGVQIRLSTDSAVLKFGQIPSFKCDVRNNGKHSGNCPFLNVNTCLKLTVTGLPTRANQRSGNCLNLETS